MIKNITYWFLGNCITIHTGVVIMAFLFILEKVHHTSLSAIGECHVLEYIIFIIPFLGGFFIKILKKDMPVYYYGTIGLIYQSGYLLFLHFIHRNEDTFWDSLITIFLYTIIASMLGGFMIDIVRIFRYIELKYFSDT